MENDIKDLINIQIDTLKNLNINDIIETFNILDNALLNDKNIYILGNGGSASTASHLACDFNKAHFENINNTFNVESLVDNNSLITALGNDFGYENIFKYQLQNKLKKDDIIIAISGSGNSKNIINAINYAKENNAIIIGLTGYNGGKLKEIADISIDTNLDNMQLTEDIHLTIEHILITLFYDKYGKKVYNE